jgi:hypothetical protein
MITNRRGFLGIFGAAAVAAPSVNFNDVMSTPVGLGGSMGVPSSFPADAPASQIGAQTWAKKSIKKLLGKTAFQRDFERQRFEVYQWDINVVALRSVSLPTRLRMSRDRNYERSERREKNYLEGVINGFW